MRIGIGTATFFQTTFAGRDPAGLIDAIAFAVDQGVSHIDTAPLYGFGLADELLKSVVAGRRQALTLATKCGFNHSLERGYFFDSSRPYMRDAVLGTLQRIGTEYLDYALVSYPGYVPREQLMEGWSALQEMQQAGLVREIGLCNCTPAHIEAVSSICPPALVQVGYSLIAQENEPLFDYCAAQGIRVTTHGPRFYGVLVDTFTRDFVEELAPGDCRRGTPCYVEPRLSRNITIVECLRDVGARHGCAAAAIALAWVLHNAKVDVAYMGASTRAQVTASLAAAHVVLSPQDISDLQAAVGREKSSLWPPAPNETKF